jgi:PAS domain-containing protein
MKQVEKLLAESERHMKDGLARSRVVITTQDRDLRYTWLFNADTRFESAVGKLMSEFAKPEQYLPADRIKRRVLETGQVEQAILKLPDHRGHQRTYDMTVTPTLSEGEVIGLTTVTVDLTDLLSAQEELHQANARLLGLLGDRVMTGKTVIRAF